MANIDIRKIKQLVSIVQASDIAEVEIKEGECSIRIARTAAHPITQMTPSITPALPSENAAVLSERQPSIEINDQQSLRAPMVGTVYLSPSPDAAPFAVVGQQVNKGDTLCLIEAMKMFNHIEAETSGVIGAVLVENASPVEFDQPLFIIK